MQNPSTNATQPDFDEFELTFEVKVNGKFKEYLRLRHLQQATGIDDLSQLVLRCINVAYDQHFKTPRESGSRYLIPRKIAWVDPELPNELYRRMEPCLRTAQLLRAASIQLQEGADFSEAQFWESSCQFIDVIFTIHDQSMPVAERETMFWHLYLSRIAGHALSRAEFEERVGRRKIGFLAKNRLWVHNKSCLHFFIKRYQGLFRRVDRFKTGAKLPSSDLEESEEIQRGVAWLQEFRKYFPFCTGCQHDGAQACFLWEGVSSSIREFLEQTKVARENFFGNPERECRCPLVAEDLLNNDYLTTKLGDHDPGTF